MLLATFSMDAWIYQHVASNMLIDPWIYQQFASNMLIDPWIYCSNISIDPCLLGRPEADILGGSGGRSPPSEN